MKIIIFGIGKYYQNRKDILKTACNIEIIAYTDNNKLLWGKDIDGIPIISPVEIKKFHYDAIIIMSTYVNEIHQQLIELGVRKSKIQFGELFQAKIRQGERKIFQGKGDIVGDKGKILIISSKLKYTGGSIVVTYAAIALKARGYDVIIAVSEGDENFIQETVENGITVVVCPALPYIYEKEKEWINEFDFVIINVFPMLHSAYACGKIRPTFWWIHEASEVYASVLKRPWNSVEEKYLDDINIYAVSNIAKKNFNSLFSNRIKEILHYGIPDTVFKEQNMRENSSKVIFAIIGYCCELKAQDVFVKAASQIANDAQAEFWIIGLIGNNTFGQQIKEMSKNIPSIKIFGEMTRKEIYKLFPNIDVVVSASREDCLPVVMTEGMMFGKVCITTDKTGTADYIQNGINGFIVPAGDIGALKEKMEWVIENKEKLNSIGLNSRRTYEENFNMNVFGDNLERVLLETKRMWEIQKKSGKEA